MSTEIIRKALFSDCRKYRYALWRRWQEDLPGVLFIGLNPSTADERSDDPTIRRCIRFARSWGYGRCCVANLFAFCHPHPKMLFKATDPVGPDNDLHLTRLIAAHDKVVLIWGSEAARSERFQKVLALIDQPYCLSVNKNGQPSHPLYLRKELQPKPFCYGHPGQ